MIYLNEKDLLKIGIHWDQTIGVIKKAVYCLAEKDFVQPIKPYLRYGNLKNRIIAMPAFIGGAFQTAGIKWIASFPDNKNIKLPRAHSVVILNHPKTGVPEAIINSGLLSVIRTASVSGLIIDKYLEARKKTPIKVGIIGWGPIGKHHCRMCIEKWGNQIEKIRLFDLKKIYKTNLPEIGRDKIEVVCSWEEAYQDADIFITCTVSSEPYINLAPKSGSLHLNVSLRDYQTSIYDYMKNSIIVDSWEEVCRENTDIEKMVKEKGLVEAETNDICDVVISNIFHQIDEKLPIMFNPMGMALFDMAIASFYLQEAKKLSIGIELQ